MRDRRMTICCCYRQTKSMDSPASEARDLGAEAWRTVSEVGVRLTPPPILTAQRGKCDNLESMPENSSPVLGVSDR